MTAPDAARMSAWRDEVAGVVEVYLDEHAAAAVYDETCGTCAAVRRRALTIADALLPLLARIEAEARIGEREQIVNAVNALRPDAALPSPVAYRVCQRDMLNLLRDRADSIASEVSE